MRSILKKFIDKCLSVSRLGDKWFNGLVQNVVEAGRTISYVEILSNKADTIHLEIKQQDRKTFMHKFEKVVRFAIAKIKLKKIRIAFDTTEDLTWMKESYNLRHSVYEKHLPSWQYFNVSIVEPYFIPLMSIPYTMLDNLDSLVIDMLKYIKTLPITVELILFDRGFYHSHLIDYLNGNKRGYFWNYLMLVPETEKVKEYIEQTNSFNFFQHEFKYSKDKSSWKISTTIIVKRIDEKACWCYATNQKPSLLLIREYSKRWNIETGFMMK